MQFKYHGTKYLNMYNVTNITMRRYPSTELRTDISQMLQNILSKRN